MAIKEKIQATNKETQSDNKMDTGTFILTIVGLPFAFLFVPFAIRYFELTMTCIFAIAAFVFMFTIGWPWIRIRLNLRNKNEKHD